MRKTLLRIIYMLQQTLVPILLAILLGTIIVKSSAAKFGSIQGAINCLRGDPLVPDRNVIRIGLTETDSKESAEVKITNQSTKQIRLLGARSSCVCTVIPNLPINLPSGAIYIMKIKVKTAEQSKPFSSDVYIYTDSSEQPSLKFTVYGLRPVAIFTKQTFLPAQSLEKPHDLHHKS